MPKRYKEIVLSFYVTHFFISSDGRGLRISGVRSVTSDIRRRIERKIVVQVLSNIHISQFEEAETSPLPLLHILIVPPCEAARRTGLGVFM
ncbi:hypothetical protein J6590_003093 [Homalodisca vitripennis]|nr:hypothetical protein J6590_003093 [Homalodisca vitripennis]